MQNCAQKTCMYKLLICTIAMLCAQNATLCTQIITFYAQDTNLCAQIADLRERFFFFYVMSRDL